jgi:predicted permease
VKRKSGDAANAEPKTIQPPRLATLLLRAFGRRDRRDEIDADLHDLFDQRAAARGRLYAWRRYWLDVLSVTLRRRERDSVLVPARNRAGLGTAFTFDARQAVRAVRRMPSFFALAGLTLAIGFAAHFAAFTVVDRLLLASPPHVEEPDALRRVHIERADIRGGRFLWYQNPYAVYQDLRAHLDPSIDRAAYRVSRTSLGAGADARLVSVAFADGDYFRILGASASLGRVLSPVDDPAPSGTPVIVLSDGFWRGVFAADPGVLGRTLKLGAKTFTIIGVTPPGFAGDSPEPIDAWAPLHAGAYELPAAWTTNRTIIRTLTVLVRIPAASSAAAVTDSIKNVYLRTIEGTDVADPTARVVLAPIDPSRNQNGTLTDAARIALWLQGVAALVLFVAVANVVNLQLSRAVHRRREMAVRLALGAGPARIVAQLAMESVIVVGGGAVGAIALTWLVAAATTQLLAPGSARSIDIGHFALVVVGSCALAALICTAAGTLHLRGERIADRLRTGRGGDGFSRPTLRQGLLVAQIAISAILLVGAGLFVRSVDRLGRLQFGMDQDRVLTVMVPLRNAGYSNAAIEVFYERALVELRAVPGVEAVSAGQSVPFRPSLSTLIALPGTDELPVSGRTYPTYYAVTPDHFRTVGGRILRGRAFLPSDRAGAAPVIIVEQALGEKLWPGEDALGKCLILGGAGQPCREVVGVASNTRRFVRTAEGAMRYYVPLSQRISQNPPQALLVRTHGDPAAAAPAIRAALVSIAPDLPFPEMRTLRELAEPETRQWRMGSALFVACGAVALFVTMAGVYALLGFIVAQRSREIGVRLALGATPAGTTALIVRQSLAWAVPGIAIGLFIAAAVAQFVEPLLFETSARDGLVFLAAAGALLAIAAAASAGPAFRAGRVDPNVALQSE